MFVYKKKKKKKKKKKRVVTSNIGESLLNQRTEYLAEKTSLSNVVFQWAIYELVLCLGGNP
jgi:hypothetical protein